MKNTNTIVVIFIVTVILLLSITQAISSNMLSTSGISMSKISKELQAYKTENAETREKLFRQTSLNNIASKASELGFEASKSQFVVEKSLPLAIRQ